MSIIRIGLAETKNFSEGYDLIFGKKDKDAEQPEAKQDEEKKEQPKETKKKKKK